MDQAVVERARGGDRAAMAEVLERVAPSIHRFATRMCRNAADADDVLQDALLFIATNLGDYEARASLPSWAFTIARTACSRKRRGRKNAPAESDDVLVAHSDDAPDPEERASRKQLADVVERAIDGLPDEHREVVLLRDVEGFSAGEAAVVLGISEAALKSRLHRSRAALRDALNDALAIRPRASSCPDVVEALSRKLEDELDADACAEIERHVTNCPACADTCDALKDALRSCRALDRPTVSAAVQARVKAALVAWLRSRG